MLWKKSNNNFVSVMDKNRNKSDEVMYKFNLSKKSASR